MRHVCRSWRLACSRSQVYRSRPGRVRVRERRDRHQFLVRATSGGDAEVVAARHDLSIVGEASDGNGEVVFLASQVADTPGLSQELDNDTDITAIEENHSVRVPEAIHPRLAQSTAAILETLPDRTVIPYYGRSVWRGYAFQPAAVLINAPRVHATFGSGGGTVAIIDTAIDGNHPVLAGAIVPGFDFIRNQAAIGSDLGSISQSTAAILEGERIGEPMRAAKVNQFHGGDPGAVDGGDPRR